MALSQLFDRVEAVKAMFDWAAFVSGYTSAQIRWANLDGNVLTRPYMTLNIISDGPADTGYDERTYSYDPAGAGTMSELVSGARELILSVNIYTDKPTALNWETTDQALDVARNMRGAYMSTAARAVLSAAGLTLLEMTTALDLSEIDGEQWIARAGFDVRLGYSSNITEDADTGTGWISTIELTRTADIGAVPQTDIMTLPE